MAKKNVNAQAMVNTLVETAFVGDMTDRQQELTQSQKLHNEAGDKVAPVLDRNERTVHLRQGHAEKPKNGAHLVKVVDVEAKRGYNGRSNYDLVTLRDEKTKGEWQTIIGWDEFDDKLGSLDYWNKAILTGLEKPDDIYNRLKVKSFIVWTVETEDKNKKTLTYFDNNAYQKRCMAIAYSRSNA